MKRLVITVDKKAIWLLSLSVPLIMGSMYFFSLGLELSFAEYGMKLNSMPVFVVLAICEIVVYALMMNQLVTVINLKEDKIGFGIFNLGKVGYPEIKKIHVGNKLELHTENKIKYVKILSFDNNKEKYMDLIKFLDEKIDKRIKPESIFGSLAQYENAKFKNNKGVKPDIGGLLMIFAIVLVLNVISNITSMLKQPGTEHSLSMTIFFGLLSVLSIITAICFFGKKPVTVILFKIHYVTSVFGYAILNYTNIIIYGGQISALAILATATGIVFLLLVFRYLNTSKRVKATFLE